MGKRTIGSLAGGGREVERERESSGTGKGSGRGPQRAEELLEQLEMATLTLQVLALTQQNPATPELSLLTQRQHALLLI